MIQIDQCEEILKRLGHLNSAHEIADWILQNQNDPSGKELLACIYECYKREAAEEKGKTNFKFPIFEHGGEITKNALVLIALYVAFKKGLYWVPKNALNKLTKGNDSQQARHLKRQGFPTINSDSWTEQTGLPKPPEGAFSYALLGTYVLEPAPHRKKGLNTDDFEKIKRAYKYRCATCGAEEGKEHYNPYYATKEIVKLQKGHMNPHKPPAGNIIPQCQFCNRAYRNWWVFDRNGRVIGIADWSRVLHSLKNKYLLQKAQSPEEQEALIEILKILRLRREK